MGKRTRYTDEQRAAVCAMLEAMGYPDTKGALQKVADHYGIQPSVIMRWFRGTQNPPPSQLVIETKQDLERAIRALLGKVVDELDRRLADGDLDGRALVTLLGVGTDKMLLLRGEATERIETTIVDARDALAQQYNRLAAASATGEAAERTH